MGEPKSPEQQLLDKREELMRRMQAIQRDLARTRSADSEERATEGENDSTLEEIGHQARDELELVNRALERIRAGEYGACAQCGGDIGAERLAALPYATMCVRCAASSQA